MKAEWMPVEGSAEQFGKEVKQLQIKENGINLVFYLSEEKELFLVHCQKTPFRQEEIREKELGFYRLAEIQLAGEDQDDHHGAKYTGTLPGKRLKLIQLLEERNSMGKRIVIEQADEKTGLLHRSCFQFFDGVSVLESWTEVENRGSETLGITYLSSFCLNGLTKSSENSWDTAARLTVPSNSWYGEFQWKTNSLPELGMYQVFHYSTKRLSYSATGTWNSHEYLPMGFVNNADTSEGWFFSIIHSGSWHWEIGDSRDQLYLQLSGPAEAENHWYQELKPTEAFESVHAAVAVTVKNFEDAVWQMTAWRRRVRLRHTDHEKLPVIFNDFMNCLGGDPNEEKELPLIDAAAEIGCEYYTIDAGWYARGSWWSRVGEWEPAPERWPNGIEKVLSYIREKGMVPGLWLELEVMGIHCPIAETLPDDWFFVRHGKRVIDHGRYQLDF